MLATRSHHQPGCNPNVCPHFWRAPTTLRPLTSNNDRVQALTCLPTAEPGWLMSAEILLTAVTVLLSCAWTDPAAAIAMTRMVVTSTTSGFHDRRMPCSPH